MKGILNASKIKVILLSLNYSQKGVNNVEILTEKLKQEINDLGGSLYPMVPFDELKQLSDHIIAKYDIDLPDGYQKILGIMDGFNFDGVFLY